MSTLPEVLAKLRRPLEYASRNDYASLHSVQGLEKTVSGLVGEGLDVERDPGRKELLRELKILFLDFDAEPESEKRRKLGAALDLLVTLEKLAGVTRAAEDAATEPPVPMPPAEPRDLPAAVPVEPAWAREGNGEDEDEEDEEDEPAEEPLEGAGILPAVVPTGPQPVPEAGRRRRRRRGGRRRRGRGGDAPAAAGAPPAVAGGAAPAAAGPAPVARPMAVSARTAPAHPEAGPIRILGAEPPIPARMDSFESGARPVVRPGDAIPPLDDSALDFSRAPEVSAPEAAALRVPDAELRALRGSEPPPAPRLDDVKTALARLDAPVTDVKGVGPKIGEMFAEIGIRSVEDLLLDLPRAYQDRSKLKKIGELAPGTTSTVMGTIKSRGLARVGGRPGFEMIVADDTGEVRAKWFHAHRGMDARFPVGARVIFAGKFERFKDKLESVHPEIEVLDEEDKPEAFARVTPVYALTEGLGQKTRRNLAATVVEEYAKDLVPAAPFWARQKRSLAPLGEALKRLNSPSPDDDVNLLAERATPWHRALVYDELFALQVGLALRKRAGQRDRAPQLKIVHNLIAKLAAFLPYPLTDAQEKVLAEIKRDLLANRPMHRLLQGDVGSGKTVVALMAALVAIENRHQVALMAPTEILAEQHYLFVKSTLERLGVKAALLVGSGKKPERDEVLKRVAHGDVDLVVGTHTLIQEGVQFRQLSLVIIDEQHRFGVTQRQALRAKGAGPKSTVPHVLIMTATPIPRTLALTEFGDLDVSVIDRMPPGRSPVETRVAGEEERSMIYAQIRSDVSAGRQAFVVFPIVEGNSDQTIADAVTGQKKLQRDVFPEFRVGLLHGQMTREEKEGVMTRFKNGAVDILATTTVVEVGIDVPNATVMLVEHAERFGLAQLHQLRGRVGRGGAKSRAFFMIAAGAAEDARDRIAILERTGDGFEVAQADLELRGPGDVTGTRQAGMPAFRNADPLRDMDLMVMAREDAFAMVNADPKMREPEHRVVHEVVKHRWKGRLNLADVG